MSNEKQILFDNIFENLHNQFITERDVSSVVEHLPYKQMAIGSNPIHPIIVALCISLYETLYNL